MVLAILACLLAVLIAAPPAEAQRGSPAGEGGPLVTIGPDGAREATFDPRPRRPSTDFAEPDPTGGIPLPLREYPSAYIGTAVSLFDTVGGFWAQSLEASALRCKGADLDPAAPLGRIRGAIRCLMNKERAKQGMRRLRLNRRLRKAATRHSRDMVGRSYFSHQTLGGGDLVSRVRRARYIRRGDRFTVGENLAWGAGSLGTPRLIVRAWMESPEHRANVLNRRFREIGIGVVRGAPVATQSAAVTYTTNFGRRR